MIALGLCRCRHREAEHGTDRRGRAICRGSVVCGCAEYRPDNGRRRTPADFRDRYDPDDNPARVDMGAHRVDVWPETVGDV